VPLGKVGGRRNMTKFSEAKIKCPACEQEQSVTIWDSINVTLDPSLREMLFSAEINVFACENCGEEAFIPAQLLYHDMDRQFCVQYCPFDHVNEEQFLEMFDGQGQFNPSGMTDMLAEPFKDGYLMNLHIVFDMLEMLRYIQFRENLYEHLKEE
jgi:hypothetical protein